MTNLTDVRNTLKDALESVTPQSYALVTQTVLDNRLSPDLLAWVKVCNPEVVGNLLSLIERLETELAIAISEKADGVALEQSNQAAPAQAVEEDNASGVASKSSSKTSK